MVVHKGYYHSPIGWIEIEADSTSLLSLKFLENDEKAFLRSRSRLIVFIVKQIDEYFKDKRKVFELPFHMNGTDFQMKVWEKVQAIPFGKTTTYLKIADQLGSPKFARAVGNTIGKNPFPIIIPCHRVIGENKELAGYSGGLWRKQWLIEHEIQDRQLSLKFKSKKSTSSKY
jgi:methylated-DNA-[protein]-cysteine S-methyltransferase